MKRLLPLFLLSLAACSQPSRADRAADTWYPAAEVVCRRADCHACHGSSHLPCDPCAARGWNPCRKCTDGSEECTTCNQTGLIKGKRCWSCNGKKRRDCSTCNGTKKVTCVQCSGKTQISCLREIPITEALPSGPDSWPPK